MESHLPTIFQMPAKSIVRFSDHTLCRKLFLCGLCWMSIFHMTVRCDAYYAPKLKLHSTQYFYISTYP